MAQTRARQTQLVPVAELTPGQVGAIRNQAVTQVVALVARELSMTSDKLVVRDIRPYDDLYWCTNTDAVTGALSTNTWIATADSSATAKVYGACISTSYTTMADQRYVAIYGVRDMRLMLSTAVETAVSVIKITVGGNDRVIWDLQNMAAYPNQMVAVCPSVVVIPQGTDYQIYMYSGLADASSATDIAQYLVLEGFVVEPRGKVLSP